MPSKAENNENREREERRNWLSLLSVSSPDMIRECWDDCEKQGWSSDDFSFLRHPEIGLAMVRGRAGGTGQAFNLGEMTVVRCVINTQDSATGAPLSGMACMGGRDKAQATLIARLDALFQDSRLGVMARDHVVRKLEKARQDTKRRQAEKTAATRVEFFTMERGS